MVWTRVDSGLDSGKGSVLEPMSHRCEGGG